MNVKTLTGSSIPEALANARSALGDDIVLVESSPATEDAPARITVMIDESATQTKQASPRPETAPSPRELPASEPGAEARDSSSAGPSLSGYGAANGTDPNQTTNRGGEAGTADRFAPPASNEKSPGRGRIFPSSGENAQRSSAAPNAAQHNRRLEAQMKQLTDRLDGMERRFSDAMIGSGQRWVSHPLFRTLLDQGMRPGTLTGLFGTLVERGHDPETTTPDDLQWALAQVLRDEVHTFTPKRSAGALAVMGPSGSGKTSLLLKLAMHGSYFGRREPAIIHIVPEHEDGMAYQNPTEVYRQHGLPVQNVSTEEEMAVVLDSIERLGNVLIDTPPLSLPLTGDHATLRRFERLLHPIMPLDVHFVVSATHTLDGFDADTLAQVPLSPSALALTRLDEARGLGRVAEWLMTLDLPVQFVSDGRRVPESVRSFSSTWLVEEMLNL